MSSLKKIMNHVEEESHFSGATQRRRDSIPSFGRAPDSAQSASSYASPADAPFIQGAAQGQGWSPSSHMAHWLIPETSLSPGAPPGGRRRSNASNDSMDSSSYAPSHGYGPMSASSGPPRPYIPAAGTGSEAPVKLTPVTGRVSRAKKGAPVHICELCRPPKTFTRAEHLRRHQLSHKPPDLACSVPGCDKVFHRKDLLERHRLRHEQEARGHDEAGTGSARTGSRSSASPFLAGPTGTQGFPLAPSASAGSAHGSGLGLGVTGTDVNMGSSSWSSMGDSHGHSGNSPILPPHEDVQGSYRIGPVYAGSSSTDLVNTPYMSAGPSNPWEGSGVPSAPANSHTDAFSTSTHPRALAAASGEWNDAVASFPLAQRGVQRPVVDSPSGFYAYDASSTPGVSPAAYDSTMGPSTTGGYAGDGSMHSPDHLLNTTVRSLTPPPLAVAQSPETLATMPQAVPSQQVASQFTCTRPAEDSLSLLGAQTPVPASLDAKLRSAIPAYVDVFWDKIDPFYPVTHISIFERHFGAAPDHLDLLSCSMAALATQFLEDKDHRISGGRLHAYVWESTKMFTQSEDWSLPIMHAVLLSEYYARFRGRQNESHRPSARFSKLYQMVIDHQNAFTPIPARGDSLSSWKQWVGSESRRRLLAGCFMLDVHSSVYYEQHPMAMNGLDYSSPFTLPIPLSASSRKLWGAPDDHTWGQLVGGCPPVETVGTALSRPLAPETIASMPPFDASILLAASVLSLPRRRSLATVDATVAMATDRPEFRLAALFSQSGIANTYMALHYTPLHVLLSVSGDSWVFNRKVGRATRFSEHRKYLDEWCRSDQAVVAVVFAARALKGLLGLSPGLVADGGVSLVEQMRGVPWRDISDYWGVYVCALICWAYGQGGSGEHDQDDASRRTGFRWILSASEMEPGQLAAWTQSRNTLAVVCLARDVLARDCMGGRNILFADSVGVLKKLGGRDGWRA